MSAKVTPTDEGLAINDMLYKRDDTLLMEIRYSGELKNVVTPAGTYTTQHTYVYKIKRNSLGKAYAVRRFSIEIDGMNSVYVDLILFPCFAFLYNTEIYNSWASLDEKGTIRNKEFIACGEQTARYTCPPLSPTNEVIRGENSFPSQELFLHLLGEKSKPGAKYNVENELYEEIPLWEPNDILRVEDCYQAEDVVYPRFLAYNISNRGKDENK